MVPSVHADTVITSAYTHRDTDAYMDEKLAEVAELVVTSVALFTRNE